MEINQKVRNWIEDMPKRGGITFSMDEVVNHFPNKSIETIQSSIYRLIRKKQVCSVWRGFYVVIPDEYALRGYVPPIEYINNLMHHLGHIYYVGLLSAAAIHGSSHQQPQSFMVVVNSNDIRNNKKLDSDIHFVAKAKIKEESLQIRNTSYGQVKISNPVMTMLDCILYENRIGGLERAATVINGLIESVSDITNSDSLMWTMYPISVIQRLGFIVESVLGYKELGEEIYRKAFNLGISFRKNLLYPKMKNVGCIEFPLNKRWKIVENINLEIENN